MAKSDEERSTGKPKKGYRLGMYLQFIESLHPEGRMQFLLDPLGTAIRHAANRADDAESAGDDDYADEAREEIEGLLGISFVVCQTSITEVISQVKRVQTIHGQQLSSVPSDKRDMMQMGSRLVSGTPYSAITTIDAFANYYKHRDEWVGDWQKLDSRAAQKTVAVVSALGAERGISDNLRTGAKVLGNSDFSDVHSFAADIGAWRKSLVAALRSELESFSLLS